jgi:hypothetical protein
LINRELKTVLIQLVLVALHGQGCLQNPTAKLLALKENLTVVARVSLRDLDGVVPLGWSDLGSLCGAWLQEVLLNEGQLPDKACCELDHCLDR